VSTRGLRPPLFGVIMIKLPNPFRKPTAREIAARDLEDARRHLLEQQAQAEYHTKMAEYYRGVEARLARYLKEDV
jgi:hypothetical protein